MYIIEKQGLEKQELLAQITAYYTTKLLGINTNNVSLEFDNLGKEEYGNVAHIDGLHLISINKDNGVTKIIESVSHELRHVWQAENGWDFDYSLPYHDQPHEKDAWEFMYKFTSEYRDVIYQEYLNRKERLMGKEVFLTLPPEYSNPDSSAMVGLSYKQKTNKKGSTKMTKKNNNVEELVTNTPAVDESSVAEENKTEKDEVIMEQAKVITIEEHNAIIAEFKEQFEKMQTIYEDTISQLTAASEARAKEVSEIRNIALEQEEKIAEAAIEIKESKKELDRVLSLRKADARRIEKLENEVGRAKLKLREHNARKLEVGKVTELPEEDKVSKTVHARIVTAGKIDGAAQNIHEKAPEKIAHAAEKTKDGIQWAADKAKGGVDLTAIGTNYATEKIANAMTFVADKIAPTTETVVESIFQVRNGEQVAVFNGVEYKVDANGKIIF